jgi:hypothetical protein
MKRGLLLILIVSIAGIAVAGCIVIKSLFLTEHVRIVFQNRNIEAEGAGEIVKGTILIQPILLPEQVEHADAISIDIFFATYKRVNRSTITVTLCQGNTKVARVLDTRRISHRDFHRILFTGGPFHTGPAQLIVEGNDGITGNAVTVSLTSDVPFGPVAKNGAIMDKGLIMKIGIADETPPVYRSPGGRIAAWVFMLTYAGIMAVTCVFLYRQEKARDADAFRGKHV